MYYVCMEKGVTDHIHVCQIKTLEWLNQAIKQASRDELSSQALISEVKILDCHCRWEYRAHSGDYP